MSKLKEKNFTERKSRIVEMYNVPHTKNIRHVFIAVLLIFVVHHIVDGVIHKNRITLQIDAILDNFSDGHLAILGWLTLFGLTLLVYPVFQFWANSQPKFTNTTTKASWNYLWLIVVIIFYYQMFAFAGRHVMRYNLSISSSFFVTLEATRLLMKIHAFIRTNVTKYFREQQTFKMSPKLHYLEFLFMPTFIYRESYPRTTSINWKNVLIYSLEACGCTLYINYIYNIYLQPDCEFFKTTPSYRRIDFYLAIFKNIVPAICINIIMFYYILHAWQNLFGELTRFADKQFYEDWWNSTSHDEFYRKWNVPVHDWLYTYVYKDAMVAFSFKSPFVPKLLVFVTSSAAHDYVIAYTTKMYYPVLGMLFLSTAIVFTSFRLPKTDLANVAFLCVYGFGCSILLTSQVAEFCVRQNPCAVASANYPTQLVYSKTLFSDCVV